MNVRVQFYAQLRELIGAHKLELELPQGATVRELLEKVYAQRPGLRAHDKSILVGAGLEFVDRNYKLAYAQTWTIALQQTLPHNVVMELEYVGTKGTGLDIVENPNQTPPGSTVASTCRTRTG